MAADNSPLHLRPMAITALFAVLILFGLKFAFDSYYVTMFEAEEYRKVGSVQPTELNALHAAEAKSFASAPIPLDKAMALVARGRADAIPGVPNGGIVPQQSDDTSSLYGWAQALQNPKLPPDPPAPSAAPATSASAAPLGSAVPAGSAAPVPVPVPAPAPSAKAPLGAPSAPAGSASSNPAPRPYAPPGAASSAHP